MSSYRTSFVVSLALAASVVGTGCAQAGEEDAGDAQESSSDYTSCFFGFGPIVTGAIDDKYRSLGACLSFLGPPRNGEIATADGKGSFVEFLNGSIYYRYDSKQAYVVRGEIRDAWGKFQWENGALGWPLSDETLTPDGGRFNVFEGGSIYWSMLTGAHEVRGAIRDKWAELGWERGLGYPINGEYEIPGGIRSDFQRGSIIWHRDSGKLDVQR